MQKFTVSAADVAERINASVAVKTALLNEASAIAAIAAKMIDALQTGHKIIFFGNGGSAADAQHFAAELVGKYYLDRKALPAIALTTNTSSLTAISNDYGFDHAFSRQLEALGAAGDVAVAISTSGKSANILKAVATARKMGMLTVGLTGENGGALKTAVDCCICVPTTDTPRIQEAHTLIGHIWCELAEKAMST
jgi:D-sedoheptulose 7-phosphate isomerase